MTPVRTWSLKARRLMAIGLTTLLIGGMAAIVVLVYVPALNEQTFQPVREDNGSQQPALEHLEALRLKMEQVNSEPWQALVLVSENTADAGQQLQSLVEQQAKDTELVLTDLVVSSAEEPFVLVSAGYTANRQVLVNFLDGLNTRSPLMSVDNLTVRRDGRSVTGTLKIRAVWVSPEARL